MKKLLILFLLLAEPAYAQTAAQVLPGYATVNSCPGGMTACYKSTASPVNSAAGEASHVFLNKAGVLYGFSATNSSATAGFVLVYNATSAPGDGAVTPIACYALPATSTIGVAFTPLPLAMSTGITLVFSTGANCFTQTSSAVAFFLGEVL